MNYFFSEYLNLEFKTDGLKVWWWSSNVGQWFPEMNISAEVIERGVKTGTYIAL